MYSTVALTVYACLGHVPFRGLKHDIAVLYTTKLCLLVNVVRLSHRYSLLLPVDLN